MVLIDIIRVTLIFPSYICHGFMNVHGHSNSEKSA
jgi:hypothetical protein